MRHGSTSPRRSTTMSSRIGLRVILVFIALFFDRVGFAASMVVFDFDQIHSQSKKGITGSDIEAYMEGLFGSDISVSRNTTAVNNNGAISNSSQRLSETLTGSDSYLKVGKGKGTSGITIDFGDNPIDSFSVDFRLFKRAKNFSILADGVVINQQVLTKSQRKTGLAGHQNAYFFDAPVHTLQFVGVNKKSFAIDNLAINIPLDEGDAILSASGFVLTTDVPFGIENPFVGSFVNPFTDTIVLNQVTAVPEASSLLMLAVGLCGAWFSRRLNSL
jgi:hypothetical protein